MKISLLSDTVIDPVALLVHEPRGKTAALTEHPFWEQLLADVINRKLQEYLPPGFAYLRMEPPVEDRSRSWSLEWAEYTPISKESVFRGNKGEGIGDVRKRMPAPVRKAMRSLAASTVFILNGVKS